MKLPVITPMFRMAMRIVSIVVWLLTIISAYGGKVNPDFLTIPAVLCLALPWLAILSGLLIIYWVCAQRFIFSALGVLTIVACSGPLALAFPLNTSKAPTPGKQTFKIISWNVLHTDDIRKSDYPGNRAVEYMIESGADIICMAELNNFSSAELKKATPTQIDSLIRLYPFRAGLSSTDIKIMSKYPVDRTGLSYVSQTGHHRFDFFKVHFPGGNKLDIAMVHLYSYDLSEQERNVMKDMKT
ncbi:MAG: hypothetical protein K2J78_03760, partial [Muribaculaceae bacterium]|nr:hypothetical protein [Muribaculaceae bacterium]